MTWKDSDFIMKSWVVVQTHYFSGREKLTQGIEELLREAYNAGKKAGIDSAERRLKP